MISPLSKDFIHYGKKDQNSSTKQMNFIWNFFQKNLSHQIQNKLTT